jgi:hypothetical protein
MSVFHESKSEYKKYFEEFVMRIALVSTYPPIECGIGTYSSFLVDAIRSTSNEMHIVSQYGAKGKAVYPAYCSKQGDIAKKIFDMTMRFTPDVVHIQHEYGLFGEMDGIAILDLIYRLKSTTMPVVATLHTVHPEPSYRIKMILSTMCRELDTIIVHEKILVDILQTVYGADPAKIAVIPHGAREMAPVKDAKEKLQLNGKKVILLVGYFRPTKCFERIVEPLTIEIVSSFLPVIKSVFTKIIFFFLLNFLKSSL